MPTRNTRSSTISPSVTATTGVPRTMIRLVAYWAQTNRGSLNQVIPGARILWIVTMKLSPVKIDENPATKTPMAVRITLVFENMLLYGV